MLFYAILCAFIAGKDGAVLGHEIYIAIKEISLIQMRHIKQVLRSPDLEIKKWWSFLRGTILLRTILYLYFLDGFSPNFAIFGFAFMED